MSEVERREEEGEAPLAKAIGAVTALVVLSVVGVYGYGVSRPVTHTLEGQLDLAAPPAEVYGLLSDFERRPTWRPQVERIGRIQDDDEGHPVWRELDASDDRFDFVVLDVVEGERVVLGTASPEQIGYDARWTFQVAPGPSGSRLVVEEVGTIANPLWRGLHYLQGGPWGGLERELHLVAAGLGEPARAQRLR